eukprot:452426-Amphidinium_carterae.1
MATIPGTKTKLIEQVYGHRGKVQHCQKLQWGLDYARQSIMIDKKTWHQFRRSRQKVNGSLKPTLLKQTIACGGMSLNLTGFK